MKNSHRRETIVYLLTLCYMIPTGVLLIINAFCSLFQTTYFELYQYTEKPLYKKDSPVFLFLLAIVFLALCGFCFRKFQITERFCAALEKTSLIFSVVLCLLTIFIYRTRVSCDSQELSNIAIAFLNKDYSAFTNGNYLVINPHQLAMIAYIEITYFLFGAENFVVLQFFNVIAIYSIIYFLHRITKEVFHNFQVQALLSVLCIGLLPLYLYSTFIYGDIPGLGFAVPAIYLVILYMNSKRRILLVPASLCMAFSILFKTNNYIIFAALFIILLLHSIKEKELFSIVFAVTLLLVPFLGSSCLHTYYVKTASLTPPQIPEGTPMVSYIAMGLQQNEYIENGWFNEYNWNIYAECNYDTEQTTEACAASIRESIKSFLDAPRSCGLRFFYKKFISQWNDPGYQSQITNEWYSRHRDDQSSIALSLIYGNGRLILEGLMNIYHFFILLGASAFAVSSFKKRSLNSAVLILCVFGGYFFHTFWEACGRYALGYFVLCVPMAAYGLWLLSTAIGKLPLALHFILNSVHWRKSRSFK